MIIMLDNVDDNVVEWCWRCYLLLVSAGELICSTNDQPNNTTTAWHENAHLQPFFYTRPVASCHYWVPLCLHHNPVQLVVDGFCSSIWLWYSQHQFNWRHSETENLSDNRTQLQAIANNWRPLESDSSPIFIHLSLVSVWFVSSWWQSSPPSYLSPFPYSPHISIGLCANCVFAADAVVKWFSTSLWLSMMHHQPETSASSATRNRSHPSIHQQLYFTSLQLNFHYFMQLLYLLLSPVLTAF